MLTDVFLASAWSEAASAAADLAAIAEPAFAPAARGAGERARASLNRRFLDDENRRINFAVMKGGRGQAESTVWPLQLGNDSRRLRIIDARLVGDAYTIELQGRSGQAYRLELDARLEVRALDGAREVARHGSVRTLEVRFRPSPAEWADAAVEVRLGRRGR